MIGNAIFATSVRISNFRGYGEFSLPIPAAPCVVLLSGPNGLGKTSLFEAVEWALTGSVKRLDLVSGRTADPRDLARRTDGVREFEVGLSFLSTEGNEERVSRKQLIAPGVGAVPASVGTSISAVARILRSDETKWNVTGENLGNYLHLTHLHAQAAALRLVTSTAKERWVRVSPLAGADRFERVRTNLTNTKAFLTKLRDRRVAELEDATTKQANWLSLLGRLTQLQKIVSAGENVVEPREVVEQVADLRLRLLLPALSGALPSGVSTLEEASEVLRLFRLEVEASRVDGDHRREVLSRLRVVPRQVADLTQQLDRGLARSDAINDDATLLTTRIESLVAATSEMQLTVSAAKQRSEQRVERHDRLIRALQDRRDLAPLRQDAADADEELKRANLKLEDAEVELRRWREMLGKQNALAAARDQSKSRLAEIEQALSDIGEMETLQRGLDAETSRRGALAEEVNRLEESSAVLTSELAGAEERLASAEVDFSALRDGAAELQNALAVIAEHIREEHTSCPVCGSTYERGELRTRAEALLRALNPQLADAERRVSAMRSDRDALRARAAAIGPARRKLIADLGVVVGNQSQLSVRLEELAQQPLIAGMNPEQARVRLREARSERLSEIQGAERDLEQGPTAAELKRGIAEAGAAIDTQGRFHAALRERRNSRHARLEEVLARIAQMRAEFSEADTDDRALALLVPGAALDAASARDTWESAAGKLAETHSEREALQRSLASAEKERRDVASEISAIADGIDVHRAQWMTAGLSEPIGEQAVEVEMEQVVRRRRELEDALSTIADTAHGLRRWQDASDLQQLEQEVQRAHSPRKREEHTLFVEGAVEQARSAVANAQRARDAADVLSEALNRVTANFGQRALKPFGELFGRYLRALIHDERFHGIEAAYKSSARSASLRFMVDIGGSDTDAEYILSEGQLGEVSLAAMLAASTAFPWSRWKALLLDDPTQYNDLIHVTALFDVLRNLVRSAGYQVIISTHDNEQAAFLRRKLDSVGIPWVDCRYVAHGENGIEVDVRGSSSSEPTMMVTAS